MASDGSADTFANRDDPIPVLNLPAINSQGPPSVSSDTSSTNSKPTGLKQKLRGSVLPGKGNYEDHQEGTFSKSSLQDRLLAK